MLHSTFSVPRVRPVRPSRVGGNPPSRRTSVLRRLAGVLALLALLTALPAPVLAAPAEGSPAFSGTVVLDWVQGLLARLGVVTTPALTEPEGPSALRHRLAGTMDPDGVTNYGTGDGTGSLEDEFLGGTMDPEG